MPSRVSPCTAATHSIWHERSIDLGHRGARSFRVCGSGTLIDGSLAQTDPAARHVCCLLTLSDNGATRPRFSKWSTVATELLGVSGRAMIEALIADERNPARWPTWPAGGCGASTPP